jgi:hypothetical protein
MVGGNSVTFRSNAQINSTRQVVSEYSTDKWAPDADHWIHTARHEAGHAVALVCMHREFARDVDCFERILIRPGATGAYVTRQGRRSDCLGCVERGSELFSPRIADRGLQRDKPLRSHDAVRSAAADLEIKIVAGLAGPLAEMCSWNETADFHSQEYRWACEDNKAEIRQIEDDIDELRAMTGRGTKRSFEQQSYHLLKREWSAVMALADELISRRILDNHEALAVIEPWLGQSAHRV